jgi:Zn-dependent protease
MGLLSLLFKNPTEFVLLAVALLYALIIHEVAHGWVAEKMGDSTARWMGRLSLNPARHLDPIGTVMLLVFGFGWAKPVPVNFNNFRDFRKGLIFVSAAGITANILLAFLALVVLDLGYFNMYGPVAEMLWYFARINIMLAAFNLIPIPPLDGSKILMGFASREVQYAIARLERYGFLIIVGLLWSGLLNPVIGFLQWIIVGVIKLLLP